jgi:pyrrolidone-carboxylate peptidase
MNIVVSHFDAFGGSSQNNSEFVAYELKKNLSAHGINVELCSLRTVYDKAFYSLEDCLRSQSTPIDFVISLGEANCHKITIETRGINNDKSYGPDNDGVQRNNEEIYPGEAYSLGSTLAVEKAYCSLSSTQKKKFYISASAGSFVCNNTLYHSLRNLSLPYSFIHVPKAKCSKMSVEEIGQYLTQYIVGLSQVSQKDVIQPALKNEVKELLESQALSACEKSFYQILKGEY